MNHNLEKQLKELVKESVISKETANDIQGYYQTKELSRPNRLFTIFGVLGALLSGLGIILIIAHNWDDMGKTLKCLLAFFPMVLGQALCAYAKVKNKGATWVESSSIFLLLAVGATISLISQIYNIPGDLGAFLLVWILITAPMMYLLRSNLAVIFHLILTTWYACEIGYSYKGPTPWWYVVFIAWALPFYLNKVKKWPQSHITGVLNWLLPLSLVIVLATFTKGSSLSLLLYLGLFGLFYNLGKLPHFQHQKLRRNGFTILGSLGIVFMLILMTFESYWKDARLTIEDTQTVGIILLTYAAAIGILAYGWFKKYAKRINLFQYAFLIAGALYLTLSLGYLHAMILTNILVATLGIMAIRIGIQKSSYAILNYGLLIISILILCRFFDTDIDFIIRGILFISVGVGFFFTNYLLHKKQQHKEPSLNTKNDSDA